MSLNQPTGEKKIITPITLTIFALVLITCFLCLCIAIAIFLFYSDQGQPLPLIPSQIATPSPEVIRPPLTHENETTPPTPGVDTLPLTPQDEVAQIPHPTLTTSHPLSETLQILEETTIQLVNPIELAHRLGEINSIPATLEAPDVSLQIGMRESFWVGNTDANTTFQITAELRDATEHAFFWVQENLAYDEDELRELAVVFETQIYPTTRDFFGSEWSPGIDNDPHLYILYAEDLGSDLAGYFSSMDEYPPQVYKYSNAHEIFLLNADVISLGDPQSYSVLAHEFQHMILWNRDRNEASWVNEGFSELASFINGYYQGGFIQKYTQHPDTQLNDWPDHLSSTAPHYGASYLFFNYLMGRFGEETIQALIAQSKDGFAGMDTVLADGQLYDYIREENYSTEDVFLDWTIATFLNDPELVDGRFAYSLIPYIPQPKVAINIQTCPSGDLTHDVAQYAVDYIQISCNGNYTLHFEGSMQTKLLPTDPHSGIYAFWSNKSDEADMTLTREFDFRNLSAPLSLSYWTWYDLEEDYDYLYLMASTDGENWQILKTPSGTAEDPSGNNFGWAYNGYSGSQQPSSWIQESVDISQFAGKTVYLRFEYVTDAAVYGEGFLLDDISIPQAGYFFDFENNSGGWVSDGWVRVQNILPQTFHLALISLGETTSVEYLSLGDDIALDIPISISAEVDEIILVVTGTTRYTRQRAAYRISINP